MPMSKEAAAGLRAAVEYNPDVAQEFMYLLRDLPIAVRYKQQDRYGPLSLMLSSSQTKWIAGNLRIPCESKPFPEEMREAFEIFNAEWLGRSFTKQELANAIEQILKEIAPHPLLEQVQPGTTLVFTAKGKIVLFDDIKEPATGREIE